MNVYSTIKRSQVLVIFISFISGLQGFVESAAGSDWSLSASEDYIAAFINLTYFVDGEERKLHTEKTEVIQSPCCLVLQNFIINFLWNYKAFGFFHLFNLS